MCVSLLAGLEEVIGQGTVVFHAGTSSKDGTVVTSGGRVLLVLGIAADFSCAAERVLAAAKLVKFEDAFYRKDIGHSVLPR